MRFNIGVTEWSAQNKQRSRSSVDGIGRPVQLRIHASCNLNRSRRRINTGTQLGKCESSKLVIPCRGSSHRRGRDRCYVRVCAIPRAAMNAFLRFVLRRGWRRVVATLWWERWEATWMRYTASAWGDSTGEVSTWAASIDRSYGEKLTVRLSSLRQTRTNFGVAAVAPTHGRAFYPFAFKPGFHYFPIIRNSPSRAPRRGEATVPAFAFLICYIL